MSIHNSGIILRIKIQINVINLQIHTLVVIGSDCTGRCKSDYHTITNLEFYVLYIDYYYQLTCWQLHCLFIKYGHDVCPKDPKVLNKNVDSKFSAHDAFLL